MNMKKVPATLESLARKRRRSPRCKFFFFFFFFFCFHSVANHCFHRKIPDKGLMKAAQEAFKAKAKVATPSFGPATERIITYWDKFCDEDPWVPKMAAVSGKSIESILEPFKSLKSKREKVNASPAKIQAKVSQKAKAKVSQKAQDKPAVEASKDEEENDEEEPELNASPAKTKRVNVSKSSSARYFHLHLLPIVIPLTSIYPTASVNAAQKKSYPSQMLL